MSEPLPFRLRERARIRRQIPTRKSVQEGKPDRIADLLEEAADRIDQLERRVSDHSWQTEYDRDRMRSLEAQLPRW